MRIVLIPLMALIVSLIVSCIQEDPKAKFWYPIALYQVHCSGFSGEVFVMDHTTGWSSASYTISKELNKKIVLGMDCTHIKIKKYKEKPDSQYLIENGLAKYIVTGF